MLKFTTEARDRVRFYLERSGGELTALRIAPREGEGAEPSFDLTLVGDHDWDAADVEVDGGGFPVLVDRGSAPKLTDAVVDFVDRNGVSGFQLLASPAVTAAAEEPREAATPEGGGAGPPMDAPKGPLADRVRDILDTQINPAVAAHGGEIVLAGVKETEIFIIMGGGCQGCALSRMTLRQGVERMIRQAVPEVTVIHDVTDHDLGEDPYY